MMTTESDDEDISSTSLFQDPSGYYQSEKPPTFTTHTLPTGETLTLSLVGHNPLWGHHLFHSSRVLASYLHTHGARLCADKSVLELGAGAGLPGLAAARYGASKVVMSDYPDVELVQNIALNIKRARSTIEKAREEDGIQADFTFEAQGYVWGREPQPEIMQGEWDTMVLSDLMFNHSQHGALVKAVRDCLASDGTALVFFTPHRPWLAENDLEFFKVLEKEGEGLYAKKVIEERMETVMFEGDRGDEEMRRMVWGWEVRWEGGNEHIPS